MQKKSTNRSFTGNKKDAMLEGAKPVPQAATPAQWDREVDVIVVGSGAAGLSAAVRAAEKGAKVIALEKAAACGGDAYFAIATGAAGSRYAIRSGVPTPPYGALVESVMLYHAWKADSNVVRTLEAKGGETLDWLEDMGVVYDPAFRWGPGVHTPVDPEHPEEGIFRWHPFNARGFIMALEKRAGELGVEILTGTPATALIMDGKRVAGVAAEVRKEKKLLHLKGKVTILAAGGYGANQDMMRQYALPRQAAGYAYYIGCKTNTGDAIRMAQGIGADVEAMGEQTIWDGGVPGVGDGPKAFYTAATQLARQPSLTVNKLGKRFFNEVALFPMVGPGLLFEAQANQIIRQLDMTAFTIHDAQTSLKNFIIEKFQAPFCEHPCSWFESSFEKLVADGVIMKAETIEELARLMDVDAATFRETVDRYNEYCDKGEDGEYFKPAQYLAPLKKPPFYAVKQVGGALVCTQGGLRVNGSLQVLDKAWEAIPGLYAAGQTMSWAGELRQAFPSGRIAGENGAGDALGK